MAKSTNHLVAIFAFAASSCTGLLHTGHFDAGGPLDPAPPLVSVSSPSEPGTDGNFDVLFEVSYQGAASISLSPDDVSLVTTGNASCSVGVSGLDLEKRIVSLSQCTGLGTVAISLAPHTAKNLLGVGAPAPPLSASFVRYVAGPAVGLGFFAEPTNRDAGSKQIVLVDVRDASGNRVGTSSAQISLHLLVNPGGAVLNGSTTKSAVAGRATFDDLSINRTSHGYYLQASAPALKNAVSQDFAITLQSGRPTRIELERGGAEVSNNRCSGPFSAVTKDTFGNLVPQDLKNPLELSLGETGSAHATFFSATDYGCLGTPVSSVQLGSGEFAGRFFMKHPAVESFSLLANDLLFGLGSASVAVNSTSPSDLWVSSPGESSGKAASKNYGLSSIAVWTGSEFMDGVVAWNPKTNHWRSLSQVNAPDGLGDASTAIWTGDRLIVWGGNNGSSVRNTGGQYNPETDTWTPTSVVNAPTARQFARSVWTGTEMIVWGGVDYANDYNAITTGGRYNPLANSWTAMSTSGAPIPREGATFVWTGQSAIYWGGLGGSYGNSGGRYFPATDTWLSTSTASAPSGRTDHTAVWTGQEMFVWGGFNGWYQNTGGLYDPLANTWRSTTTSNAPAERQFPLSVWTGAEVLLVSTSEGSQIGGRYQPLTNTWTLVPESNGPLENGYSVSKIAWAGEELVVASENGFGVGGKYNPVTDTWWMSGEADSKRFASLGLNYSAVWTGTEFIVWGGAGNGVVASNQGYRFDPSKRVWRPVSSAGAPSPRYDHSAVWTGSEMIVWGGFDYSTNLNSGGRYDPVSDTWSPVTTVGAPAARMSHTSVWTGSEMIIWGGTNGSNLNSGSRYNPGSDTWVATTTTGAPSGRSGHTSVWTGTEMIVWGGGSNTGSRYSPGSNSWSATNSAGAPTSRTDHTAVWTGSEMIIWGGVNSGTFRNTGGRYDPVGNSWVATSTTGVLSARSLHSAVWTGSTMIVFGGLGALGSIFGDSAKYDPSGNTWTLIAGSEETPSPRRQHRAVWTGAEMLLYGGYGYAVGSELGRYVP